MDFHQKCCCVGRILNLLFLRLDYANVDEQQCSCVGFVAIVARLKYALTFPFAILCGGPFNPRPPPLSRDHLWNAFALNDQLIGLCFIDCQWNAENLKALWKEIDALNSIEAAGAAPDWCDDIFIFQYNYCRLSVEMRAKNRRTKVCPRWLLLDWNIRTRLNIMLATRERVYFYVLLVLCLRPLSIFLASYFVAMRRCAKSTKFKRISHSPKPTRWREVSKTPAKTAVSPWKTVYF